jgi:4-oxalocrotonate tautomerase family enzyme
MPHIVVSVLEGMPYEQKKILAREIAGAAAGSFKLPVEMVYREVTFTEVSLENCAPAIDFTEENPPIPVRYISIHIIEGRPLEQKRQAVKEITGAVARILKVPPDTEDIVVEIIEVNPANVSHGGVLTIDMKNPPVPLEYGQILKKPYLEVRGNIK